MKTSLLLAVLLVTDLLALSQRFIPVYPESLGDVSIVDQMAPTMDNWKTDMIVFDNKLLVGGPMDGFLGFEELVIAWNGTDIESFGPMPTMPSDRVHSIVEWNNQLYIFGKLSEYNHAAELVNGNWESASYIGDAEILEALVFQDEIIARTNAQGEENVIRFNGDIWYSLSSAEMEPVNDMIVYNGELLLAAGNHVITFDGNSNEAIDTPGYTVHCFSIMDNQLILSGLTDDGEAYFQVQDGNNPWTELMLPVQADWGGAIGQVFKVDNNFIVNETFPGTFYPNFINEGRSYNTNQDSKIPLPFGVTKIVSYLGKEYALLHRPADFNFFLRTIEPGNDHGHPSNGVLHPYVTPTLSNFDVRHMYNATAGYRFHDNEGYYGIRSTIQCASPWFYSVQAGDTSTTMAAYQQDCDSRDFGPVTDNYDIEFMRRYYRVWTLTSGQIQFHQDHCLEIGYVMPVDIRDWPAHGIPGSGESEFLAPFVDMNGDGMYVPETGDYPLIKGDVCSYYILNNTNNTNNLCVDPGDFPATVPIELHVMHYLFDDGEPWLTNTSFINYRIQNKSDDIIDEFRFGYWADLDIGTSTDDYAGSNEEFDYYYAYNADAFDEASTETEGYDEYIPAQGVILLSGELASSVVIRNSTNPVDGHPSEEQHVINYPNATWKDGEHITCGGNGIGGDENCDFMYNDLPWESGWNQLNEEIPYWDFAVIGSFNSLSLPANDCICIDLALTSALDTMAQLPSNISNVGLLHSYVPSVKEFYSNELMSCNCNSVGMDEQNDTSSQMMIYPNPASSFVNVELRNAMKGPHNISVYDVVGKIVMQSKESIVSNLHSINVDVSSLHNGVYYLQMTDANQQGSVVPLVIRH